MKILPIEALAGEFDDDARAALAEADVIIGVDVASRREFTLYGTPSLESTMTLKRPSAMRVVQVLLDCQSGELEELAALVQDIKGLRVPRRPK
jgi:hypothetical protein